MRAPHHQLPADTAFPGVVASPDGRASVRARRPAMWQGRWPRRSVGLYRLGPGRRNRKWQGRQGGVGAVPTRVCIPVLSVLARSRPRRYSFPSARCSARPNSPWDGRDGFLTSGVLGLSGLVLAVANTVRRVFHKNPNYMRASVWSLDSQACPPPGSAAGGHER